MKTDWVISKTYTDENPSSTTSTLSPGSRAALHGLSLKWGRGAVSSKVPLAVISCFLFCCTAISRGSSVTSCVLFFSLGNPSVDQKICCCLLPTFERVNLNSNLRLLWKKKIVLEGTENFEVFQHRNFQTSEQFLALNFIVMRSLLEVCKISIVKKAWNHKKRQWWVCNFGAEKD